MGIWDEGVSPSVEKRGPIINQTPRDSNFFFFPHHPGMLLDAALELHKIANENENENEKINHAEQRAKRTRGIPLLVYVLQLVHF